MKDFIKYPQDSWKWQLLKQDENIALIDKIYLLMEQENLDIVDLNDFQKKIRRVLDTNIFNKENIKTLNKLQYNENELKQNSTYKFLKKENAFVVIDYLMDEFVNKNNIETDVVFMRENEGLKVLNNQDFEEIIKTINQKFPYAFDNQEKKYLKNHYEINLMQENQMMR